MVETGVVRANEGDNHSARSGGTIRISFRFSLIQKYVVSIEIESAHRVDSNEYTQYTIFNTKKGENHRKLSQICSYGIFSQGLKYEFETAVVNLSP